MCCMDTWKQVQIYLPDNIIFDIKPKSIRAKSNYTELVYWVLKSEIPPVSMAQGSLKSEAEYTPL